MFIFAPRDHNTSMSSSNSRQGSTGRRNRYARSSTTTSVTQLLSDSCSNLLQRLTTRVRGMSTLNDRASNATNIKRSPTTSGQLNNLTSRIRLSDEKYYSNLLDRYPSTRRHYNAETERALHRHDHTYYRRPRDNSPYVRDDKTLEPSVSRTVVRSPTSSNVLLSEKAYPYVSSNRRDSQDESHVNRRDKTPGYHSKHKIDRQSLINSSELHQRYGRHKSGHADSRTKKVNRPTHNRNGKSEQLERHSTALRLLHNRQSKISPSAAVINDLPTSVSANNKALDKTINGSSGCVNNGAPLADDSDSEKTPIVEGCTLMMNCLTDITDNDPTISEREAKRKEIQSLIMKYAAVDEAYGKHVDPSHCDINGPSTADIIANKYSKNLKKNCESGGVVGGVGSGGGGGGGGSSSSSSISGINISSALKILSPSNDKKKIKNITKNNLEIVPIVSCRNGENLAAGGPFFVVLAVNDLATICVWIWFCNKQSSQFCSNKHLVCGFFSVMICNLSFLIYHFNTKPPKSVFRVSLPFDSYKIIYIINACMRFEQQQQQHNNNYTSFAMN